MKKYFFLIIICIIFLSSCSFLNNNKMTMTTNQSWVCFWLQGSGVVTIDWGDGIDTIISELSHDVRNNEYAKHYESVINPTITITGKNITGLIASRNGLIDIDVRQIKSLQYLECTDNILKSIDVSANTQLKYLDVCHNNSLSVLDLSNNPLLETLFISNTSISSIDLSNNKSLLYLASAFNQKTSLDISQNILLKEINISGNNFTSFDISQHKALELINISENQFSAEALNSIFTALHDKPGAKIIEIFNNLGSKSCDPSIAEDKDWEVEGFTGAGVISFQTSARSIGFILKGSGNATIDWGDGKPAQNIKIVYNDRHFYGYPRIFRDYPNSSARTVTIWSDDVWGFHCTNSGLTDLNISKNKKLIDIYLENNNLTSLDLSRNKALADVYVSSNQLTALDLSKNKNLKSLVCGSNKLTEIDLTNNSELYSISLHYNQLTRLDVTHNHSLSGVNITGNQFNSNEINNLFHTLTENTVYTRYGDNIEVATKRVQIDNNPGSLECDPAIAYNRGWIVWDYKGKRDIDQLLSLSHAPFQYPHAHLIFSDTNPAQNHVRLLFTPKTPLSYFRYYSIRVDLDDAGNRSIYIDRPITYVEGDFLPEKPLIITFIHQGHTPYRAISFRDGFLNSDRYFYITYDGMDGTDLLIEFTPAGG